MVFNYTKKEIKNILIVTLVLAFVFGFNDGRPTFILSNWLTNFVKVFFIVGIGILVHDLGHDIIARKNGFNSEFKKWGIQRLSFKNIKSYPKTFNFFGKKIYVDALPIGIILAVLVTLFSNGRLYWAAVSSYSLIMERAHRLGRRFIEVTDFEEAKIAIAGPMAMVFLAVVLKMFNSSGMFDQAIFIFSVMVVYDMLPLPGLDGFKVLSGSKPLFAFGFVFIVSGVLLLHYLGGIFALLLALLISLAVGTAYVYFRVFK